MSESNGYRELGFPVGGKGAIFLAMGVLLILGALVTYTTPICDCPVFHQMGLKT